MRGILYPRALNKILLQVIHLKGLLKVGKFRVTVAEQRARIDKPLVQVLHRSAINHGCSIRLESAGSATNGYDICLHELKRNEASYIPSRMAGAVIKERRLAPQHIGNKVKNWPRAGCLDPVVDQFPAGTLPDLG